MPWQISIGPSTACPSLPPAPRPQSCCGRSVPCWMSARHHVTDGSGDGPGQGPTGWARGWARGWGPTAALTKVAESGLSGDSGSGPSLPCLGPCTGGSTDSFCALPQAGHRIPRRGTEISCCTADIRLDLDGRRTTCCRADGHDHVCFALPKRLSRLHHSTERAGQHASAADGQLWTAVRRVTASTP